LTKNRASTTEPYSPEKPVSLRRDYFIPSLLPEELIDEANLVGGPGDSHAASSIKNVFLPLTNERLSLPAGHDLYEETEEFDAADKELRKYLFQYLFENGSGNDRTAVPAAYALWYGYLYNFAGFVVLNSGVLPEVLRNNSDDWLIPKVEIPAGDIVDGTLYKHLRRVRFSKAYCEVSGTNGKNLIRIPTGLLTIASELKEPEIEPTMPDESENIEDRATYLLFDQAKGRNQESLQINLGKPMTTFWNWYAWRGDEFVDEGKKKLNTVLEREFEIRNQPQKKHDGEENEYLDDPALENVLRIDVEQLHPTRQDEGGFFLKLKTRPINELDVVEKGIVTIKMGGRSVNVKGSEQTILVPPGTVVKITVKCLTSIEHFQPKTRRFHGFMNSVLDSTKEYEYNGHLYHYTKPVEMIFEAAKAPNIDKDGFNPSVFWSALKPFETDQGQVALNIVKEHAEFAYFSRAAISHQVWPWNGRLTADLLDAAGPDEFAKFPESLDPRDGGQTNYAMKWEAWEFSDRPDFSSLRSTANLTVRRADNERQTLFTDSQGVTDKALYYRFKAQLFGRYELLGGDYAVRVKSELMLTDGKTEWKRFLKPAKKTTQLPKPAIRFAIPLTLSVDECPNSNEVKSSSIMIVLNDTWFTELGLAEECEVGIEVLDSDGQKYLNAGPDPILSGKRLNRVAKLSEQDRMSGYYIEEAENEENPVAVFTPLGPAGLTFDFATPTPKLTGSTFILSVVDINRFLVKDPSVQDATQLSEWGMAQIAIRRNVDKRLWEDTRFFNAIRNFCDLKEEQKSDEIERLAKEYFKPQPPDLEEHLETLWTA
ncbi:MAG TPA: hypothetical protein PKE66_08800, partial [Pyrinomonadaceae bacterium]|nr:hypothetical protein [Pyrinomonadaceae bacterium]